MKNRLKAELAVLLVSAVWGSSFILMKNLLDYMSVFQYLALRFALASFFLIIIFRKNLKKSGIRTIALGSMTGLLLFGGMSLQVLGLRFTTASKSAFITGLNVILVPVISALFLKKKPPAGTTAGVVLAAFGLYLLTGSSLTGLNRGDLLTMFCALCFAFQIILIDYTVAKEDPVQVAVFQILAATAACFAVWLGFKKTPLNISASVIPAIVVTGILGTALAFGAQTVAQKYTTPSRTALILTFEPVFALLFALVIPDNTGGTETLTLAGIAGSLLILSGMLLASAGIIFRKTRFTQKIE